MPIDVAPVEDAKSSYREGAGNAPTRYTRGIKRAKWKEKAGSEEAQNLYVAKMQDSIILARRKKAIDKLSDDFWRTQAEKNGASVIGTRMANSVDRWGTNVQPYLEALKNVDLPDKTTDPVQNAVNRVGAVVKALVDKKKSIMGEAV